MWVFARGVGFISIVQDNDDDGKLCVRARDRQHLVDAFPAFESDVVETPDGDYGWRISVEREVVLDLVLELVSEIDYTTNVKGEVSGDDADLHDAMLRCWSALKRYQDKDVIVPADLDDEVLFVGNDTPTVGERLAFEELVEDGWTGKTAEEIDDFYNERHGR